MTLNGAIQQLKELRDNELMPVVLRPWFDKPIETIEQDAVEIKDGRWISIGNTVMAKCSCGFFTDKWKTYRYCPNCGAKMDNEEEKNATD